MLMFQCAGTPLAAQASAQAHASVVVLLSALKSASPSCIVSPAGHAVANAVGVLPAHVHSDWQRRQWCNATLFPTDKHITHPYPCISSPLILRTFGQITCYVIRSHVQFAHLLPCVSIASSMRLLTLDQSAVLRRRQLQHPMQPLVIVRRQQQLLPRPPYQLLQASPIQLGLWHGKVTLTGFQIMPTTWQDLEFSLGLQVHPQHPVAPPPWRR